MAPAASQGPLLPIPVVSRFHRNTSFRDRARSVRVRGGLRTQWIALKKRLGTGTAPSTSSVLEDVTGDSLSRHPRTTVASGLEEQVDEVIVDRVWTEEFKHSSSAQSDSGISPEKLVEGQGPLRGSTPDQDSFAVHNGCWATFVPLVILRWRVWPAILRFFRYSFVDEKSEAHYRQESWFFRKKLALWSALFLVVNWVLATAFVPQPLVLIDKIFYYGVSNSALGNCSRLHSSTDRSVVGVPDTCDDYVRLSPGPSLALPDLVDHCHLVMGALSSHIYVGVSR
jgi:osomolarity two-component system, sensor histidine kinase SLN1